MSSFCSPHMTTLAFSLQPLAFRLPLLWCIVREQFLIRSPVNSVLLRPAFLQTLVDVGKGLQIEGIQFCCRLKGVIDRGFIFFLSQLKGDGKDVAVCLCHTLCLGEVTLILFTQPYVDGAATLWSPLESGQNLLVGFRIDVTDNGIFHILQTNDGMLLGVKIHLVPLIEFTTDLLKTVTNPRCSACCLAISETFSCS